MEDSEGGRVNEYPVQSLGEPFDQIKHIEKNIFLGDGETERAPNLSK